MLGKFSGIKEKNYLLLDQLVFFSALTTTTCEGSPRNNQVFGPTEEK